MLFHFYWLLKTFKLLDNLKIPLIIKNPFYIVNKNLNIDVFLKWKKIISIYYIYIKCNCTELNQEYHGLFIQNSNAGYERKTITH